MGVYPPTTKEYFRYRMIDWGVLHNGDVGGPIGFHGDYPSPTISIWGTFGSGGNLKIEGSNDPTDDENLIDESSWMLLSNTNNTAQNITSASHNIQLHVTKWLRVRVSAGDSTTALRVTGLFNLGVALT